MKRPFIIAFFFLILIVKLNGQDPVFSQFYINSIHLNPAVAGSANEPRVFMHYRNQWPQMGNMFITYQGSYDQYIKSINGGIGLNVTRDNVMGGILSKTNLDLIYSYRFKATNNLTCQAGLQSTFNFITRNTDVLRSDNTSSVVIPPNESTTQPDFSIGFLGMTRNSQFGFSVMHLNTGYIRFNYNYENAPVKISLFYAKRFKIYNKYKVKDNGFYLTPVILVQKQASSIMLNYGAGIRSGNFLAGMWARTNLPMQFSAAIFSVGYTFNNITIGYSYDYNLLSVNRLMPLTGAHEVTLVAVFPLDPKRGRYAPIKCPSAFVQ